MTRKEELDFIKGKFNDAGKDYNVFFRNGKVYVEINNAGNKEHVDAIRLMMRNDYSYDKSINEKENEDGTYSCFHIFVGRDYIENHLTIS